MEKKKRKEYQAEIAWKYLLENVEQSNVGAQDISKPYCYELNPQKGEKMGEIKRSYNLHHASFSFN